MHLQQQNKKRKQIFARLLIILSLVCFLVPISYAQEANTPSLTCEQLGTEAEQKFIVTILEEEIGSTDTGNDDLNVFPCIRKTECTEEPGKDGEPGTVKNCKEPVYVGLGECKPGPLEICQRVQVLVAQSGVDLLMQYIGIIYRWAAGVIGIVSVVYLVWGGFMITAAQDDTGAIDKAKEKIFQSIAGLIILFLSAVILYTINPNFFTLS